MWKKLKQKGAETVEYAIVLACIAGLCVMFSDNLKATMDGLMGNVSSSFTDSDKKDDKDALYSQINMDNLAWLRDQFYEYTQDKNFINKLQGSYKGKSDVNFAKDPGITDSDAKLVNKDSFASMIDSSDLKDCSWAFGSYTDSDGNICYNVSIYDPRKNDNKKLSERNANDTIITDIYNVNSKGQVTTIQNDAKQKVVESSSGKGYNVIRDLNYK